MPICGHCKKKFKRIKGVLVHWKEEKCYLEMWRKVVEFRAAGEEGKADKAEKKALGVYVPMTEEAKAKLKAYTEAHKEEIKERQRLKRLASKTLKERMKSVKSVKRIRRKGV